jgi:ABC-2 type transport system permease protein
VPGGRIGISVYYVPGIVALGIISAALSNLVLSVTAQRESGILKRRRAAPAPAGILITGRALVAASIAVIMTVILAAIGWFAYGAHIPARHVPALLLAVLAGAASFGCLGFALTSVIRDDDAANPVITAVTLPLYFISGIFLPAQVLPHWLAQVAGVFPVRHFQLALLAAYNPYSGAAGLAGRDILIMSVWGVAGLLIAARRFRWTPQSS